MVLVRIKAEEVITRWVIVVRCEGKCPYDTKAMVEVIKLCPNAGQVEALETRGESHLICLSAPCVRYVQYSSLTEDLCPTLRRNYHVLTTCNYQKILL